MNVRRGGLGRELGALIPTGPEIDDTSGARFEELPLDSIEPNPRQPREVFDEDALRELVTSIKEVGVLQPVVVRDIGNGRYQLVMGERRWRASREAGQATVPAIIRDTDDNVMLRDALLENLHRQQLNALEEGAAYQQLLEEFGATHEELADRIGRSRSHVSNTIRLLHLPPAVQARVGAGVLSAGHARALLSLDDAAQQEALAARIIAEGLSVRSVEEIVSVGDPQRPERVRRPRAAQAPGLTSLAERLSDVLETRVTVEVGKRKGKLVVEFATLEDLQRIVSVVDSRAAGQLDRSEVEAAPGDPGGQGADPSSAEVPIWRPAAAEDSDGADSLGPDPTPAGREPDGAQGSGHEGGWNESRQPWERR